MKKKLKRLPKFRDENHEREFWRKNDSTDFVDWSSAKKNPSFASLKPSLKSISLRLPESMIEDLKVIANKKDVPYQSLLKIYLSERIEEEIKIG